MSGFFVLVRFAAFPAGYVTIAMQAYIRGQIVPFKGVNVKLISCETIHYLRYYLFRPFSPPRKRALASEKDVPWPLAQACRSACCHGIIASVAVVKRSLHGPHNEDTERLYRASCFWCVVPSRRPELPQ